MNTDQLMELIIVHTELFNTSHPKYNDGAWKDKIWKEIADKLGRTPIACKTQWDTLREQYKRKHKTTSGQAAQKKFKKHEHNLRAFYQKRNTITNVSYNLSESSEENGNTEDIHDAQNNTSMNNENLETNQSVDDDIWKKPNTINNKQRETTGSCQQPETASTSRMNYLLEKKETSKESDIDTVDAFLTCIGATLKTFDPLSLNLVKSRIFNIVQEIEMSQIVNKPQPCAPNNQPSTSVLTNSLYSNVSNYPQSPPVTFYFHRNDTVFTPSTFTAIKNENQHQ